MSIYTDLAKVMQPYERYKAVDIHKLNGKFYWHMSPKFDTLQECKDDIDKACKALFKSIKN